MQVICCVYTLTSLDSEDLLQKKCVLISTGDNDIGGTLAINFYETNLNLNYVKKHFVYICIFFLKVWSGYLKINITVFKNNYFNSTYFKNIANYPIEVVWISQLIKKNHEISSNHLLTQKKHGISSF